MSRELQERKRSFIIIYAKENTPKFPDFVEDNWLIKAQKHISFSLCLITTL